MNLPKNIIKVNKGEVLLKVGDTCKFSYFVIHGCLKSYAIDESGKEHILQLTPENWMVTDLDGFINKVPSTTFIEAIEDSELRLLPNNFFDNSYELDKEELIIQNKKLLKNIIVANKRILSILSASAEERYLDFCEMYPMLVQRIPLKTIASYIGVTPEYLSEIRRKLARA